jgi:hypothetical protein
VYKLAESMLAEPDLVNQPVSPASRVHPPPVGREVELAGDTNPRNSSGKDKTRLIKENKSLTSEPRLHGGEDEG